MYHALYNRQPALDMAPPYMLTYAHNRLTCSPGTPPTDTSLPASSASLPALQLCSWGHGGATQTWMIHQNTILPCGWKKKCDNPENSLPVKCAAVKTDELSGCCSAGRGWRKAPTTQPEQDPHSGNMPFAELVPKIRNSCREFVYCYILMQHNTVMFI